MMVIPGVDSVRVRMKNVGKQKLTYSKLGSEDVFKEVGNLYR